MPGRRAGSWQEIDAELQGIGYDAAAHDAARQSEIAARSSEAELRGAGEGAAPPWCRWSARLRDLEAQISAQRAESERQAGEFEHLKAGFAARLATRPPTWKRKSALAQPAGSRRTACAWR